MKKSNKNYLVYGSLFATSLFVVATLYYFMSSSNNNISESISGDLKNPIFAKSKMTEFDIQLARKFMDKDNDGRCDFCGMNVDFCIDSGMLECTMNPQAKIGILGSDHIHADFKVFINGEEIDFNQEKYFVKSAFAHVEKETKEEKTGKVLHIHAKGVPLWLFFDSLGMSFDSDCFVMGGKQFCSDGNNRLRFFVNGAENKQYGNYVPKNLDKILIGYGNGNEINGQSSSITDYAKNH